jgi:hypothetical protein
MVPIFIYFHIPNFWDVTLVPQQWLKNFGKGLCVGTSGCVGKKNIVK